MAKAERRLKKPTSLRVPAQIKRVAEAASDKKAGDLVILDLRKASAFTDFFVICTGTNVRQVQAIADGIQETLRAEGFRPSLVEGYEHGQWVLIDYFDFIVHIFSPSTREFYGLERLWGDAKKIDVA